MSDETEKMLAEAMNNLAAAINKFTEAATKPAQFGMGGLQIHLTGFPLSVSCTPYRPSGPGYGGTSYP